MDGWLSLAEIQLSRYALLQLCPDYLLEGRDKHKSLLTRLTAVYGWSR